MIRRIVSPRWFFPLLALAGLGALSLDLRQPSTPLAWLFLFAFSTCTLTLERAVSPRLSLKARWLSRLALAAFTGGVTALLAQVEARFSEEEFFAALQAVILTGEWLLLDLLLALRRPARAPLPVWHGGRQFLLLALSAAAAALLALPFLRAYQGSFYPQQAPVFEGISSQSPFLCVPGQTADQKFSGVQVFERLLARVEANPDKTAAEYGMLALGTGSPDWAQRFRSALLEEAAAGRFTGAANSIKYDQYEAGFRAYYFPLVSRAFPGLFTTGEQAQLRAWFAAINRRALTVEWVDWLYTLALAELPQGPYENQASGAGLLAILEANHLADPALSQRNRQYLDGRARGWQARFRVSDDAAVYQPEWIQNAYFQALYAAETVDAANQRRSFEWLLLQAAPDGAPLLTNHLGAAQIATSAYLGAALTGDEHYLWLAGRAVEYLEAHDGYLTARPGVDAALDVTGRSPDAGSCLLYADSGLPNQPGPLAPDKLVFRDGWEASDAYLSLNLRFTGWHRYKATGAVIALSQGGLLAGDHLSGQPFAWLPSGRSLFRDKRIPRENLNGLLIPRSGLSQVVFSLTRLGGPWAQDPPFYAEALTFSTNAEMDSATLELPDWRGWRQRREVAFYHNGPIVIIDQAAGPAAQRAAIAWNIIPPTPALSSQPHPASPAEPIRYTLRSGDSPAEMLLLPLAAGTVFTRPPSAGLAQIRFQAAQSGTMGLATVFLTRGWTGAQASLEANPPGYTLILRQGSQEIRLPIPPYPAEPSTP